MGVQEVRAYFLDKQMDVQIIELDVSTATVTLAAEAHGVEPGRIAKTLAFQLTDGNVILLLARGDARIDNRKFKTQFGKGKMASPEHVETLTGHPPGGICPFGLTTPLPVFLDISLQAFDVVLPAAGSVRSAVRMRPDDIRQAVDGQWVDVCQEL